MFLTKLVSFFFFSNLAHTRMRIPFITEHPENVSVKKHEPTTLNCKADGNPVPSIEWFKDGDKVKNTGNRMVLPSGSLFFLHVMHGKDTGLYWCSASNSLGTVSSHKALLSLSRKISVCPSLYFLSFRASLSPSDSLQPSSSFQLTGDQTHPLSCTRFSL